MICFTYRGQAVKFVFTMAKIVFFGKLFGASLTVSFLGISYGIPFCNMTVTCPENENFQDTVINALTSTLHMANETFTTMNASLNLCRNPHETSFWKGLTICSNTSPPEIPREIREQFCREHDSETFTDASREKVVAESTRYLYEWTMNCTNEASRYKWMDVMNLLYNCSGCPGLIAVNDTCNGYFQECQAEVFEGSLFQAMLVSFERQLQHFTKYRNRVNEDCQD